MRAPTLRQQQQLHQADRTSLCHNRRNYTLATQQILGASSRALSGASELRPSTHKGLPAESALVMMMMMATMVVTNCWKNLGT